ncbi:HD domain-containing phosphohydrolase [Amorphus sp. 3PC139-8]|uniref:HD domain-containing phosphohydrolase n=1 Tax=Amorphus sp. 3PC139-8 TaxID=2735676 RepID=UPI00345D72BD
MQSNWKGQAKHNGQAALRIAGLYLALAVFWVLASDRIVLALFGDGPTSQAMQTGKGLAFVTLSAILIFALVRLEIRRRETAERDATSTHDLLRLGMAATGTTAFRYDRASNQVSAYPSFEAILGEPTKSLSLREWTERILPEDREGVTLPHTRSDGADPQHYEASFRLQRRDGRTDWVLARGRAMFDESGRLHTLVGVFVDTATREALRARLQHANRGLRAFLHANRAIVSARDPQSMFEAVCRSLADVGGFALVWAGLISDDASQTVRLVASAGQWTNASETSPAGWHETTTTDPGPIGRAIRTGEVQFAYDLRTEPAHASWRSEADSHGLRSAITIPIQEAATGRARGALAVFGADAGAFEENDRAILQNIGQDIGHALVALESEDRYQVAESARLRALERERHLLTTAIEALARTIEKRDPHTAGHQSRVATLVTLIAKRLGLPQERVDTLRLGALIHDIGKIGVPVEILTKPGRLSEEEFALVKTHTQVGYEIVRDAGLPEDIGFAVLQHHERLDGSGYPQGLSGDAISLAGRIVAVADVVDAITDHRPYRPSLGLEAAIAEIKEGRGSRYDASIVDACLAALDDGACETFRQQRT